MRPSALSLPAIVATVFLQVSAAHGQERFPKVPPVDLGKIEYESKCAVCHGMTAKGDGPMAALIKQKVPDLSTLAKGNRGALPVARMVAIIDGEDALPAHGTRDMPIWGEVFRAEGFRLKDLKYRNFLHDPNAYVRARILAIVDYVNRLQVE